MKWKWKEDRIYIVGLLLLIILIGIPLDILSNHIAITQTYFGYQPLSLILSTIAYFITVVIAYILVFLIRRSMLSKHQ